MMTALVLKGQTAPVVKVNNIHVSLPANTTDKLQPGEPANKGISET